MRVVAHRTVEVERTYAVSRAMALFNIASEDTTEFHIEADIPDGDDWSIGAVIGPSGSGKTTILEALREQGFDYTDRRWPADRSLLDAIPGGFDKVTGWLASVGLGSVPSWVRPYRVLSNGEKFRADLADALSYPPDARLLIDEFTSVVDRRVATIGAGAFAKAWRRRGSGQVVVAGPHHDILPWVKPDWVVRTSTTGPTVTADDWGKINPEVRRDPAAPVVGSVSL